MKTPKATAKTVAPAVVVETLPSPKQIAFLSKFFDHDLVVTKSRAECTAKIKEIIAEQRANREGPASETQLRFLADNGYPLAQMALRSKGFCSKLIYEIKKSKAA